MDEYASHLPTLRSLLAVLKPLTVLEFGAGIYSTPCFCERPELIRVLSVEPDPEWRRRVAEACDDDRLVLRPEAAVAPEQFDLVFIDNGPKEARMETIHSVLSEPHPTTVIHDADVPEYEAIIRELAINYSIYPTEPATAVVW